MRKCFEVDSRVRPSAEELLLHPYFASKFGDPFRGYSLHNPFYSHLSTSSLWVRKPHLKCLSINDDGTCSTDKMETSAFCLKHPNGTPLSLTEVFHFWKLSGGDLESELGQLKVNNLFNFYFQQFSLRLPFSVYLYFGSLLLYKPSSLTSLLITFQRIYLCYTTFI